MRYAKRFLTFLATKPKALAWAIFIDIVGCGWLYAVLENKGPIEGPWWGIVTGSTTGYGDFYPETTGGRGVAAFLMVSMWWLSILAAAQVTARLVADPHVFTDEEQRELQRIQQVQLHVLTAVAEKVELPEAAALGRRYQQPLEDSFEAN